MNKNAARPHLGHCPLCEQGLIRVVRCPQCEEWSALCDDCETLWKDPQFALENKPDSQHPYCPHCHESVKRWIFATYKDLHQAGFDEFIEGTSA